MDQANSDNTLSIQPAVPASTPPVATTPTTRSQAGALHPDQAVAVARARLQISELERPSYQGTIPNRLSATSGGATLTYPHPVSPAAENLKRLPKLPRRTSASQGQGKARAILSALATFLFVFMLFKAPVLYTQIKFLLSSHAGDTIQTQLPANSALAENVSPEPIITIPKINVSAPVIYPTSTTNSPNYDPELENGVVHYPNTAVPGQNGNVVIFGHSSNDWWQPGNYKFVFVLLDKLVAGDTFSVNYQSKRYIYQVTGTKVVEANDLSVLAPTTEPTVTLITCWPAGTSLKRQIVVAKQISPSANSAAATPAQTQPTQTILPGSSPTLWQQLQQFWNGITDGLSNRPTQVTSS